MSSPWMRIAPEVGDSRPAMRRSSVVLPQPLGPRSEKTSPRRMARLTPSTAATAPNCRRTSSVSTLQVSPLQAMPANDTGAEALYFPAMSETTTLAAVGGRAKNHYYYKHIGDLKQRLTDSSPREELRDLHRVRPVRHFLTAGRL